MNREELLETTLCACGEKSIAEAIAIFQNTSLPYPKAKKLVTGCNKSCCRRPLMRLFDMVEFGRIDLAEIARLMELESSTLARLLDSLGSESATLQPEK
jgi:hypothetical protein